MRRVPAVAGETHVTTYKYSVLVYRIHVADGSFRVENTRQTI